MKKLIVSVFIVIATMLVTGCGHLDTKMGGIVVGALYGRSGVFVTNNYQGLTIQINTNNGITATLRTGDTAQIWSAGLYNGDRMLLVAKFYDAGGRYVGYDQTTFTVWYGNGGGPWVRDWDPRIIGTYARR